MNVPPIERPLGQYVVIHSCVGNSASKRRFADGSRVNSRSQSPSHESALSNKPQSRTNVSLVQGDIAWWWAHVITPASGQQETHAPQQNGCYSITSSARTSSGGGISRPSATPGVRCGTRFGGGDTMCPPRTANLDRSLASSRADIEHPPSQTAKSAWGQTRNNSR